MSKKTNMHLRNKALSQGRGQIVTPLRLKTEGSIRMCPSRNTLNEEATIRNFRIVQTEGTRQVARDVAHYNLDVIWHAGSQPQQLPERTTVRRQRCANCFQNGNSWRG